MLWVSGFEEIEKIKKGALEANIDVALIFRKGVAKSLMFYLTQASVTNVLVVEEMIFSSEVLTFAAAIEYLKRSNRKHILFRVSEELGKMY